MDNCCANSLLNTLRFEPYETFVLTGTLANASYSTNLLAMVILSSDLFQNIFYFPIREIKKLIKSLSRWDSYRNIVLLYKKYDVQDFVEFLLLRTKESYL